MSFDPSVYPFLTPYSLSGDATFGTPNAVQVTCNTNFGLQTIWSGVGGTLEIRPYGNLLNLSSVSTYGLLARLPDGSMTTRIIQPTDSTITLTNPGGQAGNIGVAVTPSSVVQLFNAQVAGTPIGSSTNTINFIAGTNVVLTPSYANSIFNVTINAPNLASTSGHFVTYQADSALTNSFNLGSLGSGILKQAVVSGVATPAIAVGNTDYMLPNSYLLDLYGLTPSQGSLFYFRDGHWTALAPSTTSGQFLTTIDGTDIGWTSGSGSASSWSQYPATQNVNMATHLINNLGTPVASTDACTKGYADSLVGGAPVSAYYLTTQSNSSLINETNLGSLPTGLVLSTVLGGISTISTVPSSSFQPANLTATVTTTNATPTTLITVTLTSGQAVTLNGVITAKNSGLTAAVGGFFNATAINVGGTCELMGTPLVAINASAGELFQITVSGATLIVQVTGIAATTYTWNSNYTIATL